MFTSISSLMRGGSLRKGLLATYLTSSIWLVFAANSQESTHVPEKFDYPEPRFPQFVVNASQEQLLDAARIAVRQSTGITPLGKLERGDTVHIFLPHSQDDDVWRAIKSALAELQIKAIPVMSWELADMSREEFEERAEKNMLRGDTAWKEMGAFETAFIPFFPPEVQDSFGQPLTVLVQLGFLKDYLDKHEEIEKFFAYPGGMGYVKRVSGEHAYKFIGNWVYESRIALLNKSAEYPPDVWNLVEDQILKPRRYISAVTFRDPEGTRLRWDLTPSQARLWANGELSPNHLYVYPFHATWSEGTVVATSNHTGFFEKMVVEVNQYGRVTSVEGGGRAGELFRMLLDHPKFKNARFPSAPDPDPGYWYLRQDGFATNPKKMRNMELLITGSIDIPNLSERERAGVQHFSFSSPSNSELHAAEVDLEYAEELGVPVSHTAHMHNYFGTVRWKLADSGEWLTISDRGILKAYQSPEVQALAANYGDPDTIFSYDWIPEIPGINAPGDYELDYAPDPWGWVVSEWERIQKGSYQYLIDNYDMTTQQPLSN